MFANMTPLAICSICPPANLCDSTAMVFRAVVCNPYVYGAYLRFGEWVRCLFLSSNGGPALFFKQIFSNYVTIHSKFVRLVLSFIQQMADDQSSAKCVVRYCPSIFLVRLFLKNDLSESKILLILFCVREQQIQSCSCALKSCLNVGRQVSVCLSDM